MIYFDVQPTFSTSPGWNIVILCFCLFVLGFLIGWFGRIHYCRDTKL